MFQATQVNSTHEAISVIAFWAAVYIAAPLVMNIYLMFKNGKSI